MTKAVEPYTDEEKERHSPIANDEGGKALLGLLRDANSCAWEATAENLEATQFNIDRLLATIEARDARIAELEGQVFVPGLWKCPKCELPIVSSIMSAQTGEMAANTSPHDCPNGCGPMWRATERQERKELGAAMSREFDRAEAAEARVSELENAMEPFVRVGNMLTEYPSGSAILYQASGDPSMKLTSDHCHAAVAAMFPTPPEEEAK